MDALTDGATTDLNIYLQQEGVENQNQTNERRGQDQIYDRVLLFLYYSQWRIIYLFVLFSSPRKT